ncbi:uncharacterized protein LOC132165595 isoform X2 [Corylus avellana]|uniref:uncharacterized protein LOC132165595 isoform X2 n=1 Tax=Corylus avellana TaxID=13451 RepID=UPI00286A6F9E|nr:uncharacterized protein LOC132165595 isoform X2 [Corylus avellana]
MRAIISTGKSCGMRINMAWNVALCLFLYDVPMYKLCMEARRIRPFRFSMERTSYYNNARFLAASFSFKRRNFLSSILSIHLNIIPLLFFCRVLKNTLIGNCRTSLIEELLFLFSTPLAEILQKQPKGLKI